VAAIKVMHLSWEYPPRKVGGLASHVYDLSRAQKRKGDEVFVITINHPGGSEYENIEGVHVYRFNEYIPMHDFVSWTLQMNLFMQLKALDVMKKHGKMDVIHIHDWLSFAAGTFLKHSMKIPLVATIHATEYGRQRGVHNQLQRAIHEYEHRTAFEAWKIIVCSWHMKREINHILGVPWEKVEVIPNGVDPRKFEINFHWDSIKSHFATPNEKIVLFIGRVVHEKGVDLLIGAAPSILRKFPNTKFVVAGGGFIDGFKGIADYCGVKDKFYFTGYVDDFTLKTLLRIADVVVVPSRYEPFGIVAIEAMTAQTPVVIADVGGLSEIVEHDRTGVKVWPDNSESLAWGVKHVLRDSGHTKWMVRNAYHKILTDYNWDFIANRTEGVYRSVLKEARESNW